MIIGLVGYHSSGKSVLAEFLQKEFGWRRVIKRELLQQWSGLGNEEHVWTAWYRDLYQRIGSYEIMHHLLRRIKYHRGDDEVLLLDSIHTPEEWRAIKEIDSQSLLVGVFIPKECRLERSSPEDLSLDQKRKHYWHTGEDHSCLLAEVEWSFCGTANEELRRLEAEALITFLRMSGRVR